MTESEVEALRQRVREINGAAIILQSEQSRVNLDEILNVKGFDLRRVLEKEPDFLQDTEHQVSHYFCMKVLPHARTRHSALYSMTKLFPQLVSRLTAT